MKKIILLICRYLYGDNITSSIFLIWSFIILINYSYSYSGIVSVNSEGCPLSIYTASINLKKQHISTIKAYLLKFCQNFIWIHLRTAILVKLPPVLQY